MKTFTRRKKQYGANRSRRGGKFNLFGRHRKSDKEDKHESTIRRPIPNEDFRQLIQDYLAKEEDWNKIYEIKKLYGPIEEWNTSNITDMSKAFAGLKTFNFNISRWDVSNVTTMENMFLDCAEFNHPIGKWNVRNVENMESMFENATSFSQDLSGWETSSKKYPLSMTRGKNNSTLRNVITTKRMFKGATRFNGDISNWKLKKVKDASEMFMNATSFNGNLHSWKIKSDVDITNMFYNTVSLQLKHFPQQEKIITLFKNRSNYDPDLDETSFKNSSKYDEDPNETFYNPISDKVKNL